MKLKVRRDLWKISASEKVIDTPFFLEDFLNNDIIAFGDYGEGDIRKFKDIEELEGKLTQKKQTKHSFPTAKFYMRFRDDVNIGDIVVIYSRNTIFGVGYIASDYYFYEKDDLGKKYYRRGIPNRRKVKWISKQQIEDERLSVLRSPQETFYELDKKQRNIVLKVLEEHDLVC